MNIYARRGYKVVYLDKNGFEHDTINARKKGLVKGQVYTVSYTDVGSWRTDVFLGTN